MRMTSDEIKVVTFVIVALLIGAATKRYRQLHPRVFMSTPIPKGEYVRPARR